MEDITLYRYESGYDPDVVNLIRFKAVRETPCGWWFVREWIANKVGPGCPLFDNNLRWVSKTGWKRHCYPTKEQAWESYRIRKEWRVKHLKRQLERALAERDHAVNWVGEPPDDNDLLVPENYTPVRLPDLRPTAVKVRRFSRG